MVATNTPAISAELGRAETPAETAERKAAASSRRRANQTSFNLVVAIVASLGIVLFLVLVVVRPSPPPSAGIDFAATASEAQAEASEPLVVPVLSEAWSSNAARFESSFEVPTWYIGLVTPSTQFIALSQGIGANPTWTAAVLDGAKATGQATIGGIPWVVYDARTTEDPGNYAFALSTTAGESTFILHGTASDAEFETLAQAIASELEKQ